MKKVVDLSKIQFYGLLENATHFIPVDYFPFFFILKKRIVMTSFLNSIKYFVSKHLDLFEKYLLLKAISNNTLINI